MRVEHERFGRGEVIKVEGSAPDIKISVNFDHAGLKQLLLKFAKLKILP
jgi:DNA helicase-2/ATP-dependent DNA helicase PcrA